MVGSNLQSLYHTLHMASGLDHRTRRAFLEMCEGRSRRLGAGTFTPATLDVISRGLNALDAYLIEQSGDIKDWDVMDPARYHDHLRLKYKSMTVALYGEFVLWNLLEYIKRYDLSFQVEHVYRTRTRDNTRFGLAGEAIDALIQGISLCDAPAVRNRVILELLHRTGPGVSELVGVILSDVDVSAGTITYSHTTGKRKILRSVPLAPSLCLLLTEYIASWRNQLMPREGDQRALLLSRNGRPLGRTDVWCVVKKHLSQLDDACPKEIRNEYINRLLREGENREKVATLAGYSQVSQTYLYRKGDSPGGTGKSTGRISERRKPK